MRIPAGWILVWLWLCAVPHLPGAAPTLANAKLKVSFFRPVWGVYWISDLDAED